MIEDKYIELINKEIDGLNSPEESRCLNEFLLKNPEAQEYYNAITKTSDILKKTTDLEPESGIRRNILNSIQAVKYHPQEKSNILKSFFSIFEMKVQLKYAFFFACGLIVGMVLLLLVNENAGDLSFDESNLTGTILSNDSIEKFELTDDAQIDVDNVTGNIKTKFYSFFVIAEITIDSKVDVDLHFDFKKENLEFMAFRQSNNIQNMLNINEKTIKLKNKGANKYTVFFRNIKKDLSQINFKIIDSNSLLFQKSVLTGKKKSSTF